MAFCITRRPIRVIRTSVWSLVGAVFLLILTSRPVSGLAGSLDRACRSTFIPTQADCQAMYDVHNFTDLYDRDCWFVRTDYVKPAVVSARQVCNRSSDRSSICFTRFGCTPEDLDRLTDLTSRSSPLPENPSPLPEKPVTPSFSTVPPPSPNHTSITNGSSVEASPAGTKPNAGEIVLIVLGVVAVSLIFGALFKCRNRLCQSLMSQRKKAGNGDRGDNAEMRQGFQPVPAGGDLDIGSGNALGNGDRPVVGRRNSEDGANLPPPIQARDDQAVDPLLDGVD